MLMPVNDGWWKRLGRSALSKMVIATAVAVGTKIGEQIASAIFDDEEDGEEEPQDDEDKPRAES